MVHQRIESNAATAGTVMIAALPIIIGLQMILSALNYDVEDVPTTPLRGKVFMSRAKISSTKIRSRAIRRIFTQRPSGVPS